MFFTDTIELIKNESIVKAEEELKNPCFYQILLITNYYTEYTLSDNGIQAFEKNTHSLTKYLNKILFSKEIS